MAALVDAGWSYALLADGRTITIRPAGPDDYEVISERAHRAATALYLGAGVAG